MNAQLYHTPHFHLRERRYVRPDYARAFRLWYARHHRHWWLPALTPDDLRLVAAWEQRRCDRRHINRAILTDPLAADSDLCTTNSVETLRVASGEASDAPNLPNAVSDPIDPIAFSTPIVYAQVVLAPHFPLPRARPA